LAEASAFLCGITLRARENVVDNKMSAFCSGFLEQENISVFSIKLIERRGRQAGIPAPFRLFAASDRLRGDRPAPLIDRLQAGQAVGIEGPTRLGEGARWLSPARPQPPSACHLGSC